MSSVPRDPKLGSSGKTFYAVKKITAGQVRVQACGAELGERIVREQ